MRRVFTLVPTFSAGIEPTVSFCRRSNPYLSPPYKLLNGEGKTRRVFFQGINLTSSALVGVEVTLLSPLNYSIACLRHLSSSSFRNPILVVALAILVAYS
jgi:hypothetical protein